MLVDLTETVCGCPIKQVHKFLKKYFLVYGRGVEFVNDELAPQSFGERAGVVLAELILRGWLKREDEFYELTAEGRRFALAKMTPPFSRTKGEAVVASLIERAEAINRCPDFCCSVASLQLFGSMLDPKIALVGDVDVAFELTRREPPEGTDWIDWNIERFEASGRKNGSFLLKISYGEIEVIRLLKGRFRRLSLQPRGVLDNLGIKSRLIFSTRPEQHRVASSRKRGSDPKQLHHP